MFKKVGEAIAISRIEDLQSCIPAVDPEVLSNFSKFATQLKKIAPKAEDFLYFSAVMMHAAEASAINKDGSAKMTPAGETVVVGWDQSNNTWKWQSNDPNVKPYKNSNGDIFPELELVKAYKKWVHKPLCIDHKSSSVDHVRGFIVDTYYDRNLKRVIALCALDKKNYPDLARKVATGYSNNVSMGTAVGRAICSDCGKVARVEADFCRHMQTKTGYGEINIDLNPIELSIVVNGADPQAYIKNIIASANTLNEYVESKEKELNKIATRYSVNISAVSDNPEDAKQLNINYSTTDLDMLKEEITKAYEKLEALNEEVDSSKEDDPAKVEDESSEKDSEDTNDTAYNQSSGSIEVDSPGASENNFALSPPHPRFASSVEAELITELKSVTSSIEAKLNHMKRSLENLATTKITQEETMSGKNINKQGYFQGGGKGNEPGAPFPVDPINGDVREDGDKHMLVDDLGPVDGMHPGPASVSMSELDRKKMLARAEAEDRAMRRNAVVSAAKQALEQKKAYFQSGVKGNDPTPGKPQYPVDRLNSDLRDADDKQMVGQKPFPGVGAVNGLHPSPSSADIADEKKRKEMLSRASLSGRFIRAYNNDGSENLGKSSWQITQGDKLLLTASVNELTGNRAEFLHDSVATREFGTKLIAKIKSEGVAQVRSFFKGAQAEVPPPVAPPPVAPPPAMPEAAPAPEAPEPEAKDTDKSGDPGQIAKDLAVKVRDLSSDLVEAVNTLIGEKAEMGDGEQEGMAATASLHTLRRELNGSLIHAMKECVAQLNDQQEELNMVADMSDRGAFNSANQDLVEAVTSELIESTKTSMADSLTLMRAFVKYARGTQAIVKRAQLEADLDLVQEEEGDSDMDADDELDKLLADTNMALDDLTNEEIIRKYIAEHDPSGAKEVQFEELVESKENSLFDQFEEERDKDESDDKLNEELLVDDDNDDQTPLAGAKFVVTPEGALKSVNADYNTLSGRAALRAKLAADALKTSPHLHEAHPKGGVKTQLDVQPSGDLAVVENLEEVHDAVMDLATAPVKVRKEAEAIHTLVSQGKLDPSDLDALVAEGLDAAAVAYYRKYWGQVEGGSEFASELLKEHAKAQLEADLNKYQIKMARAYELTYDMVSRGLCHNDRASISNQVEQIMKFNDESFDSLKRVVAKSEPLMSKQAGRFPQVGLTDYAEASVSEGNLVDQLSAALSSSGKKNF